MDNSSVWAGLQLPKMDGFTNEELLEMIAEMDDGDLMEACDEVGVDWSNFSSEDEMRVAAVFTKQGVSWDSVWVWWCTQRGRLCARAGGWTQAELA